MPIPDLTKGYGRKAKRERKSRPAPAPTTSQPESEGTLLRVVAAAGLFAVRNHLLAHLISHEKHSVSKRRLRHAHMGWSRYSASMGDAGFARDCC